MHDLIQECAPMIDKVFEDLCKNLPEVGVNEEGEDIRQEVCFQLLDLYNRHPEKFPITYGYLYLYTYFACLKLYYGEFSVGEGRLYYLNHDYVFESKNKRSSDCFTMWRLPPDIAYEDKLDDQERARRNRKTRKWLDGYGVQIDDCLGLEFALWWQGCSIREISLTIKLAKLKTLCHSPKNVTKKLHAAFIELEKKTGITRRQLFDVREMALKTPL